jgi:rhamnosyltransferase
VLLFDSQKLKKVVAITLGCVDGMFGKLGTFESRHTYLAAFCKRTRSKAITVGGNSSVIAAEQ